MHFVLKSLAFAFTATLSLGAAAHSGHDHGGHTQHDFPDPATAAAPDGVTITDCWIRALPNRLPAAGYFKAENVGGQDAVLIGAQADGFDQVMLHTHQTSNGMAAMVHADKVSIPAGGQFEFAPGGHHVMLEKPTVDLDIGTKRPLTLWFEEDRAITTECDVRPPGTIKN